MPIPDVSTALRDSSLAFVMAMSDPGLSAADATWAGTTTALVLWDVDPARARKLIERLQVLRTAGLPTSS